MKKVNLFFALILAIVLNLDISAQIIWTQQQSGTSDTINALSFYGSNYGYFCGSNGVIGKTTNGGINWILQQSFTTHDLYAIHFFNWHTGWATGGIIGNNDVGYAVILHTTNGGANWFIQLSEPTENYYPTSVYFFTESYGFAACQGFIGNSTTGGILKSTNGGANWTIISGSKPASKILFTNYYNAYCLSRRGESNNSIDTGIVYKSTDGGQNWIPKLKINAYTFKNLVFFNQNTGIAQADSNNTAFSKYYKTTDAGNSWFLQSNGNLDHSFSHFPNESSGWAVGNQIFQSTNGGVNWYTNSSVPYSRLISLYFTDIYNGWAGGNNGALYHSSFQDTTTGDFFPLKIGNKFVYLYSWSRYWTGGGSSSGSAKKVMVILDTTTFYGKKYYLCSGIPTIVQGWVRVDTITHSLYIYSPSNNCPYYYYESLVDSLGMTNTGYENSCHGYYCNGLSPDFLFNRTCNSIHFSSLSIKNGNVLTNEIHRFYNKIFGFKRYNSSFDYGTSGGSDEYNLMGCLVNGIYYGDTSGITTITPKYDSIYPSGYSLSQNYPNPFNLSTKIVYALPKSDNVKLKIFDISGKELLTLVDSYQKAGIYTINLNGLELPSGVFFYTLRTPYFQSTKKLILIK